MGAPHSGEAHRGISGFYRRQRNGAALLKKDQQLHGRDHKLFLSTSQATTFGEVLVSTSAPRKGLGLGNKQIINT